MYSYGIPQDEAARTGSGPADVVLTNFTGAATNFSYNFPAYSATVIAFAPPPVILSFVRNGNESVTLTWTVQPFAAYQVQYCNSLGEVWQSIGPQQTAGSADTTLSYTDTTISTTSPSGSSRSFCKLTRSRSALTMRSFCLHRRNSTRANGKPPSNRSTMR